MSTSQPAAASGTASSDPRADLEMMCLIRAFEERAIQLYNDGAIRGAIHSSAGQEAVAVGTGTSLEQRDFIATTHRGHGHAIAKGADVGRLMAELMGRANGFCSGKGGSMHVADLGCGMLGANGIVGASAELASGAAFASKVKGTDAVAVAVLGDGGMAEGIVHEAFNLASLWKLPVVFLCENNQYAVTLRGDRGLAASPIGAIAEAHGIPSLSVDGMDVDAVREAMTGAVRRGRAGDGPTFVEAVTYRFMGHSRGDPNFGPYRTQEEWDSWQAKDPILRLARSAGLEGELDAVREAATARITAASDEAERAPLPELDAAFDHVFPSGLAPDVRR